MLRTKCPKCQNAVTIDVMPESGRVFCSKCGQQLVLKTPAAGTAGPSKSGVIRPTAPAATNSGRLPQAVPIIEPDIVETSTERRRPKKKSKSGSGGLPPWVVISVVAGVVVIALGILFYVAFSGEPKREPPVARQQPRFNTDDPAAGNFRPGEPPGGQPAGPRNRPPIFRQDDDNNTPPPDDPPSSGSNDSAKDQASSNRSASRSEDNTTQPPNFGGGDGGGEGGEDVYPYVLKSAVFILALMKDGESIATGSGSLIDKKNRLVLTNHHVAGDALESICFFPTYDKEGKLIVEKARFIERFKNIRNQQDADRELLRGKVLGTSPQRDLCVVQLPRLPPGVEALPIAKTQPRVGQRVHSIGNPGASGGLWVYAPGVVRQVYHKEWVSKSADGFMKHEADVIETQSPTNPGDSGGPLVNDRGELVGVTQGGLAGALSQVSIFIDAGEVRRFVESVVQDQLRTAWKPEARPPLAVRGGGGRLGGNLTDLVKALEGNDPKVRTKAAEALGEMGADAKNAIPALLKLLNDPDDFTRRTALTALEKIGLPSRTDVRLLADTLRGGSDDSRRYAATTLEKMGMDARGAANELTQALHDADPQVKQSAARALGRFGRDVKSQAQPALENLLNDSDREVRLAAAEGLAALLSSANDTGGISKLLKHQDTEIRVFAVKGLAKLGKNAKPLLADMLDVAKNDTGEARQAVLQVLAVMDANDAKLGIPVVTEALKNGDKDTKIAAIGVLAALGKEAPPAVVKLVVELLKDTEMRDTVLPALSKLAASSRTALAGLVDLLRDTDESTREQTLKMIGDLGPAAVGAVDALIKLMDIPGRVVTNQDEERVDKIAAVLAKIGKPAIPALKRGLASRGITRWGCAKALGEMGPIAKEALPDLERLFRSEPNEFIREDIEDAYYKIKGR